MESKCKYNFDINRSNNVDIMLIIISRIVRCTKNRKTATEEACHSRGFLRASGDGFVIFRTKDHNHPPGDLKRNPVERSFINTLCERARDDHNLSLKDIYNQEVERFK